MTATLLMLDSEPKIGQILTTFFGERNYHVLTAQDAAAALRLVEWRRPQVLLVEVPVCPREVLDLLRQIGDLELQGDLRIILWVHTALDQQLEREARRLGVSDFLLRSCDLEELFEAVERVLTDPQLIPRYLDDRLEAQRYAIALTTPTGELELVNAHGVDTTHLQHFHMGQQHAWLTLLTKRRLLTRTHADYYPMLRPMFDRFEAGFLAALIQEDRLVGVVVVQDPFWQSLYTYPNFWATSPQRHDAWFAHELQQFAFARLEDNHTDLCLKVCRLLDQPEMPLSVVQDQTLPTVRTFAEPHSLAVLQTQVRAALAHYRAQGYLYAAGGGGPWPIALIATWDAYRTLLEESSAPAEALSALEALSGLFLDPSAVEQLVRTVRRFPGALPAVSRRSR